MGLFGFMNYNKEGPGVSKNEPQKKGFFRFFEIYFSNFWKLLVQGLNQAILTVPVVTYMLGEVGLANVTRSMTRNKHSFGTSDFFETVRKNWKQSLGVGIINIILTALLAFNAWFFYTGEGNEILCAVFTGVSIFMLFVFTIMKYYMPMLIMTFGLNIKQLYKNSFRFVFLNLKRNLLIFFSLTLFSAAMIAALLFGGHIGVIAATVLFICIYPGFRSLLIQYNIFDSIRKYMIDPYYEEHPDADIEKRLALGLDVPEEYMPHYDDESIFDDERLLPKDEEE